MRLLRRTRLHEISLCSSASLRRQIGLTFESRGFLAGLRDDGVRERRQDLLGNARPWPAELRPPVGLGHLGAAGDDEIEERNDGRELTRRDDSVAAFEAAPEGL